MRYKKTEVCQTCAKLKNVCQTCLLDLEYGLPVQVRDSAMKTADNIPKDMVNRDYFIQNAESQLSETGGGALGGGGFGKAQPPSDVLAKLARNSPYYKRNLPHICSFWVKGECRRGEECPYRHEKPTDPDDPMANQNLKDRYYGTNDPVADKLLKRYADMPKLVTPDDKNITTLYVGNLGGVVDEKQLHDYFYQFGEIRLITLVPKQNCAFVQFTTRAAAEKAADKSQNNLIIADRRLVIRWGKPHSMMESNSKSHDDGAGPSSSLPPVPGLPPIAAPLPASTAQFFGLIPQSVAGSSSASDIPSSSASSAKPTPTIHYPSQLGDQ